MSDDIPTPQDTPGADDVPTPMDMPQADATSSPSFEAVLHDVPLVVSVELGRVTMNLREVAQRLGPGSVIALNKAAGDTLDIRVNDRLVARGEAVAIGERCGIRIVEIVGAAEADRA